MSKNPMMSGFDWIRAAGQDPDIPPWNGKPSGELDIVQTEIGLAAGKVKGRVIKYNQDAEVIRANSFYTQQGKDVALSKLGQETHDELTRWRSWMEPHRQRLDRMIAERVMKPSEGDPVVRAIRASEIRAYLRTVTDPLDAIIIDAASRGDADTVEAMSNAPAGMLAVSREGIATAQQVLAEKQDPEGARLIKQLREAIAFFEKVLQVAIEYVGEDSGVTSPDEVLRKIAETGVVPPHMVTPSRL